MSQAKPLKTPRDTIINIRTRAQDRTLIDLAAQAVGKTRSDFILDTMRTKAESIVLDQRVFALDDKGWGKLQKVLDEPATPNKGLCELLARKAPWE